MSELKLSGLSARYRGTLVLSDIDCTFGQGVTMIVGPNGSGKSTLLRSIAHLPGITVTGDCQLDSVPLSRTRNRRGRVGYLPQQLEFGPVNSTVREQLDYAGWLQRIPKRIRADRVRVVASQFDLDLKQTIRSMSGGTRQRLALAQTWVREPELLLLDEPTSGIDTEHRRAFRDMVAKLAQTSIVLFTTHIDEDVRELGSRVLLLDSGKIAADDSPAGMGFRAGMTVEALLLAQRETGLSG